MQGGGAGAPRCRPPCELLACPAGRLYVQPARTNARHKVTESVISTSISAFGVPTPPPGSPYSPYSPLQLELLKYSQQHVILESKSDHTKMDDTKLKQCIPEGVGCCGPGDARQMLENVTSVMQPLTIKTENVKRGYGACINSPKKLLHASIESGCSRTNPIAWTVGMPGHSSQGLHVQVKREPQHMQMSELVAVKLEQSSPGNKPEHPTHSIPASLNNGSIPVGIAVARQRVGADAGLLAAISSHHKEQHHRIHEMDATAMTVGVANMGGVLHCDERSANQLTAWPMTSHAPPSVQPPTLWQYSPQVSMESMMLGGMGMQSGGGFQLVREPSSGALLLLPTAPEVPQAVLWGGYPPGPLILPPAQQPPLQPMAPLGPSLQLLQGDLLTSATLQHTQTHSTRLVALAPQDKRKQILQPLITPHALIKIEAEPTAPEKPPSSYAEPVAPMLTTHVFYQPQQQPTFQQQEQVCRSQATSPVAPLTPPPEAPEPAHKDASNQTDQIDEDIDSPNNADDDEREVACVGVAHSMPNLDDEPESTSLGRGSPGPSAVIRTILPEPATIENTEDSSSEGLTPAVVQGAVEKAINAIERDEALDNNSSSGGSLDLVIDSGRTSPASQRAAVDVSGLELLSNSIEQFERTTPAASMAILETKPLTIDTRTTASIVIKTSPKSPPPTTDVEPRRFEFPPVEERSKPSLDGLGLLCALAEQRFMEEVEDNTKVPSIPRTFIKSEPPNLLSPTEQRSSLIETGDKKESRHTRDGDSSSDRSRKRSRDHEERLRHKFEKIRRQKREHSPDKEAEKRELKEKYLAACCRVSACSCGSTSCHHVSSEELAQRTEAMRERLADLQRQCDERQAELNAYPSTTPTLSVSPTPSTQAPLSDSSDRGSSKKRKVGRPRKVSSPDSTETIVAKKPKSKSSLVGYLLAKGKLKGGIVCSRSEPSEPSRTSKVRPKLKAEPKLKEYSEDESEWGLARSASSSLESLHEVRLKNREKTDRLARKHSRDELPEVEFATRRSVSTDSERERRKAKKRRKSVKPKDQEDQKAAEALPTKPPLISKCTLTEKLLDTSPRVLTAMGGLFYAGKLSAVQAPDVYAITLDGERGNKPHILSREETLRDAIVEVTPSSVADLPTGTRVCAYWSQQYRCLYPGTVAEVESPEPVDLKFVAVEFDDGDSGRISIEDIRFLEPNYPVVEYDPNPLLTLGKRRRNTSANSTEQEKKPPLPSDTKPLVSPESKPSTVTTETPVSENQTQSEEERHKDRKKLKKHRKEKRSHSDDPEEYIKKKKKKHKCCEDHCKHRRHHKKHRKHRKRHHSSSKEHSSSSGDDHRNKSSDSRSNDDSVDSNDQLSTLVAIEKSPQEKMKTVIKKAILSKKALVKSAILDFSNLGKSAKIEKEEVGKEKDNMKDSGIGLEETATPKAEIKKKAKKRTVSSGSEGANAGGGASKMAAFLPGGALWSWKGAAYRRVAARPRHRKLFYKAIQRGLETLNVGDAAVFLSTGRPDRPYIGRIVSLWESRGSAMAVKVKWFYHPEETVGCPDTLKYPGGLFESPHTDENDVQTISHKCEVLPLDQYRDRMGDDTQKYNMVYENNDVYYLAGNYDPTQQSIKMEPNIPFTGKQE